MKKTFVAIAVVALFASCTKDYACTCAVGGIVSSTTNFPDLTKSEAETAEQNCETGGSVLFGITCVWSEK
jgi:hypothetical protein